MTKEEAITEIMSDPESKRMWDKADDKLRELFILLTMLPAQSLQDLKGRLERGL